MDTGIALGNYFRGELLSEQTGTMPGSCRAVHTRPLVDICPQCRGELTPNMSLHLWQNLDVASSHGQPSSWTHLNARPNNSIMGCTQTWMFTQKTKASIRGRQKGQSSVWQQLLPPAVVVKRFASTGYYLRLPSRATCSYDGSHTSAQPASTIQLLHST